MYLGDVFLKIFCEKITKEIEVKLIKHTITNLDAIEYAAFGHTA